MYLNPAMLFVCGVIGGALASVITQPADVVKTRMQIYPTRYSGNFETFMSIIKVGKPGSVKCFFYGGLEKVVTVLDLDRLTPFVHTTQSLSLRPPELFAPMQNLSIVISGPFKKFESGTAM